MKSERFVGHHKKTESQALPKCTTDNSVISARQGLFTLNNSILNVTNTTAATNTKLSGMVKDSKASSIWMVDQGSSSQGGRPDYCTTLDNQRVKPTNLLKRNHTSGQYLSDRSMMSIAGSAVSNGNTQSKVLSKLGRKNLVVNY